MLPTFQAGCVIENRKQYCEVKLEIYDHISFHKINWVLKINCGSHKFQNLQHYLDVQTSLKKDNVFKYVVVEAKTIYNNLL